MIPAANIQEELGEALSRASVLKSLDASYSSTTPLKRPRPSIGTPGGKNVNSKDGSRGGSHPGTPRAPQSIANDVVVAAMQALVEDGSNRTGKFFMDQIKGKSIILENVKTQTEATKYSEREKRRMKRRVKASNSVLKKKGSILWHDVAKMRIPSQDELLGLNNSWKTYMRNLLKGCKTSSHCQARLMTAELVGAEVIVLDSKDSCKVVGRKGVVVEQSMNCLFLACSTSPAEEAISNTPNSAAANVHENDSAASMIPPGWCAKMYRIVRNASVLGVMLPVTVDRAPVDLDSLSKGSRMSDSSDGRAGSVSQNVCVLYGSQFLSPAVSSR